MSTGQMTSEDILKDLVQDVERRTQAIEERTRRSTETVQRFAEIRQQMDEAVEIRDSGARSARTKILEANLEQLREQEMQEEKDLAGAVFGLNTQIEKLGAEYTVLSELNASEKALIENSKRDLEEAKADLIIAQQKWSLFGIRARAVSKANARIAAAEPKIAQAEAEARRRQRQRLLNADMKGSLQEIQSRAQKTVLLMRKRREEIIKELAAVSAEKNRLLDTVTKAARAVEKFDQLIAAKESELRLAEERLSTLENGTDEHGAQNKLVSNLKQELEDLIGGKNTAVVKHQEADKFSKELEIHEQAHIRLRDNLLMWITALNDDTEARVVTFSSRLVAMKASSDQQVAQQLDTLGAAVDQKNAEAMAAAGAASDRARVARFEQMPGRIRAITEVAKAQVEARDMVESRMAEFYKEWQDRYGIDPLATSYFAAEKKAAKTSNQ